MSGRGQEAAVVRWYQAGLRLLPAEFRAAYAGPMLQVVRDAMADGAIAGPGFAMSLALDLVLTAARERAAVAWRLLMRRPIAIYSVVLIVLLCGFSLISAVLSQQLLRRSANQPQQQMAERYAGEIRAGANPASVLPSGHIDPSHDLDPFVIFYDSSFRPQVSDATLAGIVPAPPVGVFEQAKRNGASVLTWMPRRDARVAMVMLRVDGVHPGFLLVGRSLSLTEQYESLVYHAEVFMLLAILVLIAGASAMLARAWHHDGRRPVAGVVH